MTSTVDQDQLNDLARIALLAAREAGAFLQTGFRSRPVATEKGRADLVTEYDVKSEEMIRGRLGKETPGMAIVGEERGGTPSGLTWYCDPLDGTMNFVHGHPFFCVSIGAMADGVPVLGAVVAPALALEWWGGPGIGAFCAGAPCRVSETETLRDSLVSTGFYPTEPEKNLAAFARVTPHVRGLRRDGSAALDCCFVANGTFDGYWERHLNAWDLVAGCAIALGAGARLTSMDGGTADVTRGHIVLTNGRVHDELVRLVRD